MRRTPFVVPQTSNIRTILCPEPHDDDTLHAFVLLADGEHATATEIYIQHIELPTWYYQEKAFDAISTARGNTHHLPQNCLISAKPEVVSEST